MNFSLRKISKKINCFKTILIILMTSLCGTLSAQITEQFDRLEHNFEDRTLPYRLFIPENASETEPLPLVLTLHGAGERGTDNDKQITSHPRQLITR